MDATEQQLIIAKAYGWTNIEPFKYYNELFFIGNHVHSDEENFPSKERGSDGARLWKARIPDYVNNADNIREAKFKILGENEELIEKYYCILASITGNTLRGLVMATSQQEAAALVKTLEK
jgi:hypothetical protein